MTTTQAAMVVVGLDRQLEGRLAEAAGGLALLHPPADARALADWVAEKRPAAAVVALDGIQNGAARLELVSTLARQGASVVALGPSKDADLILQAMRAGAQEYVVAGDEQQLLLAVRARAKPAAVPATEGIVTTVFPAKGGLGATAIATNLAGELARRGERTVLADLDLQFGDVLSFLDLHGAYAIPDVVANMHRLDRELLDASVVRHRSGLFVIGPSERVEDAERVQPRDIGRFIAFLKQHYSHVILDARRSFDDACLAALDASDRILLVVTQDVPAVRNAQRAAEVFRRLGYGDGKLRLVVNRYSTSSKLTLGLLRESIGIKAVSTLANDFASLRKAIDRGVLLSECAPRSALTASLAGLAVELEGVDVPVADGRPLLQRIFSRG